MRVGEALQYGWKLHQNRDFAAAESVYRQVLVLDATNADAWCYLGILFYDVGRMSESAEAYGQALHWRPKFPVALSNLGNTLSALERYAEAERSIRSALELSPQYANAWTNLGAVLVKQGRLVEAEQCFQKSLELSPQNEPAHRNLGAALVRQGRLADGQRHSEAALQLNPRSEEAHRNRAIVWLLTGDWERGWKEFEWRWQCAEQTLPSFAQPMWGGEPIAQRTLLLYAEQGLGDTIQFVRYATLAKRLGARVVLQCQEPLVPLLRSFPDVDEIVPRGEPLPEFDYYLPLMSAPRVFQTRIDTVPSATPYLNAEPQRIERWRRELPHDNVHYRIAIAWQGSRQHPSDKQRSVPLSAFLPLAKDGVQLISLQKGPGTEQIGPLASQLPLVDLTERLDQDGAFLDTAAIMALSDLVISVDTALGHLAGALGARVWLALPAVPDWRWLLDRSDTPWYPTMRLFRQAEAGTWTDVFAAMAAAV
jgi:Flp pilus assembly protein TadD